MNIQITQDLQEKFLNLISSRSEQQLLQGVRYLDLGVTVIRVLCYTKEIIPHLEKQFAYVLRCDLDHYDSTIVVWQEQDTIKLAREMFRQLPMAQRMRVKAEMLWTGEKLPTMGVKDKDSQLVLKIDAVGGVVEAYDKGNKIIYYGVGNFEPEEFIKQGHCFKQIINKLVKSDRVNLTHGAVFGYHGRGFLLCGRGKRGKSTLTVQSMLQGFEYVSDDFQILEQKGSGLLAYPVYSCITLSHRMYNEVYDIFQGKFMCNNATRDKYFLNISAYHGQFRSAYPVKFCLFPEIVGDPEPSIKGCTSEEKGRAIVHLLHSTLSQMGEVGDKVTICKLLNMVKNFPFYKFNLCHDIVANTAYLQKFLAEEIIPEEDITPLPEVLKDVTFGLATFLDTKECRFYAMNKFATNIFQLLCSGVAVTDIAGQLEQFRLFNPRLLAEFTALQEVIAVLGLNKDCCGKIDKGVVNLDLAQKSDYHLFVLEYGGMDPLELLKKKGEKK